MLIHVIGSGDFEILSQMGVPTGEAVVLYFLDDQAGPRERELVIQRTTDGGFTGYFLDTLPHKRAIGQAVPVTAKH